MINFLSPFATCQKEQYTLASNCPVFSCPSWKNQNNIHNLISINALKKYGHYFKQNCFIFFFEFENCYESVFSVLNKKQLAEY